MSQEPQLTRSVDDPDAPRSFGTRVKRALAVPGRLLGAMFLPDGGMPHVVGRERGGAAVLAVMLCMAIAAAVLALRVDTTSTVMQQETMRIQMQGAQQAEARSDRELQEEVDKSRAMAQVKLGLAPVLAPLWIVLGTLGCVVVAWAGGGKPKLKKMWATVSHAWLPWGVKALAVAAIAWPRSKLTPEDIQKLDGFSRFAEVTGPLARFATFDVFFLWSMALIAFGLGAAASVSRRRAFIIVAIVVVLLQLLMGALAGGGPPGGGQGPMPPRGN